MTSSKESGALSVRTKILLAVALCVALLSLAIYALSVTVLARSYVAIEREAMGRDLSRASDAIENFSNEQLFKLRDWAQWDDSYQFGKEQNPDFLVTNLVPTVLVNLDLNLLMFADLSGGLTHILAVELATGEEIEGADIAREIVADGSVTTHPGLESAKTGILMLKEGPLVVSSRPLSHTDGSGPSTGSLIFGRFLDEKKIADLAAVTHLDLSMYRYDDSSLPEDAARARALLEIGQEYVIETVSPVELTGYTLLRDVRGDPALILKVREGRPVYAEGQRTFGIFALMAGAALLASGLIVLLLIDRLVIARFMRLTQTVRQINDTKDLSRRVAEDVPDDIGLLGRHINHMLGWLSEAKEAEAAARRDVLNRLDEQKSAQEQAKEMAQILKR